jgi:hypothetical protein
VGVGDAGHRFAAIAPVGRSQPTNHQVAKRLTDYQTARKRVNTMPVKSTCIVIAEAINSVLKSTQLSTSA